MKQIEDQTLVGRLRYKAFIRKMARKGQPDDIDALLIEAAEGLEYIKGCFHAAEVEGLYEALEETTDLRLKDLVERRLMYAYYFVTDGSKVG